MRWGCLRGQERTKSRAPLSGGCTANQHEIKADRFKIKYLKPLFPADNPLFNEVFTGVATPTMENYSVDRNVFTVVHQAVMMLALTVRLRNV